MEFPSRLLTPTLQRQDLFNLFRSLIKLVRTFSLTARLDLEPTGTFVSQRLLLLDGLYFSAIFQKFYFDQQVSSAKLNFSKMN